MSLRIDPNPCPVPPPSLRSEPSGGRSFLDHLSGGLAVAARVTSGARDLVPGAGLVSVGLSGLSKLVAGSEGGNDLDGFASSLEDARALNVRYLELQQRMQQETQAFTAISNIMRVRHEAAKNTLNNVR